ncbi:restriction endonuclease subunit S [Comamonas sp. MYb69]|uniref:restriction endonuclease subunit S n=1 Tax=Comamonas sp. MYb69 TaxID=1848650 RepID=UPI0030B5E296
MEWLEAIPVHWSLSKLRYAFSFGKGLSITKENLVDEGIPCVNYGELHSKFGFEVDPSGHQLRCVEHSYLKTSPSALLRKGDFVFADTSEDIEGSGNFTQLISDIPTFAGYHTIIVRPECIDNARFFAYLFDSIEFRTRIRHAVKGVKVFSITQAILRDADVWLPSGAEQEKIAAFLDHETTKIDALIEKQQRLIELLKEKRQALISHAVTKGLDPNAPMKDSGVEWLGEVPAHWVVARYKFCTTRVIVGIAEAATHAYAESGVPIIRSTDIREDGLNQDGMLFIKKDFAEQNTSKYLYKNDVVTVRTGYPGTSAVVPEGLDQSHCFTNLVATPRAEHHSQFLVEYLNSYIGKKYFELHAWGSAQKNISVPILQDFPIAFPEREEEEKIVQYVSLQKQEFSKLIALAESSIGLMQERRTALISAAVTGKIDVRNWQAAA